MPRERARVPRRHVPKLCGADVELGNFILGVERSTGTGHEASRALLREIEAPYAERRSYGATGYRYNPQDWGRKYLSSNGGCFYIDLDHLETCLPEVLSAHDHVAAWHAMLRIARDALTAANAKLPTGQTIHVLVNNSDGRGNAYGSHLNFLLTRRAWNNIFERKMHHLLYLAAFQVSSIVYTGQGKVGVENGTPAAAYQLSQRADFFEALTGAQTTYRRPIVNSRDEALCGQWQGESGTSAAAPSSELARLHCIFFDNTLCHGSSLLKVGVMQLMLAMIEAERIDPSLILDDPVVAVLRWSHDPTLQACARMASGKGLTAVELQLSFLEQAQRFAATGGFDGVVPRAGEILALWEDTLEKLRAGDLPALAGRLDWVLKLRTLQRAMQSRPTLTWDAPEMKHLDLLYGGLDREHGLYWAYEQLGDVERLVSDSEIERFVHEPPEDTRAWTRAMLLRIAGADGVQEVDWDTMRFRKVKRGYWSEVRTLRLDDPLGFTKADVAGVIERASSLDDILDALHGAPSVTETTPSLYEWQGAVSTRGHASAPLRANGNAGSGNHWDD
jgi:Pup amidohydrolase